MLQRKQAQMLQSQQSLTENATRTLISGTLLPHKPAAVLLIRLSRIICWPRDQSESLTNKFTHVSEQSNSLHHQRKIFTTIVFTQNNWTSREVKLEQRTEFC